MPDPDYIQRVAWILRQNQLTPELLSWQYVAYKDQRAAFEAGYSTIDDMAALITPGVAAMLDLEDQILADSTAVQAQQPAPAVQIRAWVAWAAWAAEGLFWAGYVLACFTVICMVLALITNV